MRKIILVRPYGNAGGMLVIDVLCKLLREKGIDARILYTPSYIQKDTDLNLFWRRLWKYTLLHLIYDIFHSVFEMNKTLQRSKYLQRYKVTMSGLQRQILPIIPPKSIVLYPEVFYGNFLKAKNVIRWLLFYNKYKNDSNAFGRDDLVVCYRKIFNDWKINPNCLCVNLIYFDSSKYKQYNFEKREGKCYILRKGHSRKDLPDSFDGPVIDYDTEEEEIVRILNSSKYCYSYDTQTFYMRIAAVCGCIPIVVMEPGKNKSDYLSKEECLQSVGVAFGDSPEEIHYAISTREELLKQLDFHERNEENLKVFIHAVMEKFGSLY